MKLDNESSLLTIINTPIGRYRWLKHKPLETILRKPMETAPLRLQAMMLKVSGYDLTEENPPGKKQVLADALG